MKTAILRVRLTEVEKAWLTNRASTASTSLSAYVRAELGLERAETPKVAPKRSPLRIDSVEEATLVADRVRELRRQIPGTSARLAEARRQLREEGSIK